MTERPDFIIAGAAKCGTTALFEYLCGHPRVFMPPHWPDPVTLRYGAIYRYAAQVRRVLEHVPQKQRHIIVYEEFFADPRSHYANLLDFLQLAPDSRAAFPVVNGAQGARSRFLERLLRQPPRWLKALYAPMRPIFRRVGDTPTNMLWRLNAVRQHNPALRPGFRAQLERYFADDVIELESLLGRRLWQRRD